MSSNNELFFSSLNPNILNLSNLSNFNKKIAFGSCIALFAAGALYYVYFSDRGASIIKNCEIVSKNSEKNSTLNTLEKFECALYQKSNGNKYFREGNYEFAIKCYSEAIKLCPSNRKTDIAIFYQNRAASYEQINNHIMVISDCCKALEFNPKYIKAMERRAKVSAKIASKPDFCSIEAIKLFKQALNDLTSICILEGFQKRSHIMDVDNIIKVLGKLEARETFKDRKPILSSAYFIDQYFQSFTEDPIFNSLANFESKNCIDLRGFLLAKHLLKNKVYDKILDACTQEIKESGLYSIEAKLLRGTFYILSKQQNLAFKDFESVISNKDVCIKIKVNALIKKASLRIQQCKNPQKDPVSSIEDFSLAEKIDPYNSDIYHHRGQVFLLIDEIDKALKDFKKSVELNPNFGIAHAQKLYVEYRKASLEKNRHQISTLIEQFEEAICKFPKCIEAYSLFSQVLSDQQKFKWALKVYDKAQNVDEQNANIYVHRALIILQSQGNIESAIDLCNKALEVDEECEFALETLGTIQIQRGNLDKAIKLYERAIPLSNTELEMAHLYGLKNAAIAQAEASRKLNIQLSYLDSM